MAAVPPLSAKERAQLPDSAFAYIDSHGKRRLPINDASHVRNALARFGQVAFEDDEARDRARSRLLRAAQKHGIMPIGFISAQLEPQRKLPKGTVTFLLTDIERSTQLLAQLGDGYAAVLSEVRRRVRNAIRTAGGKQVSATGDEVFAVFEEASAALAGALGIQRAMQEDGGPRGSDVRLRIGLHRGRPSAHRHGLRRPVGSRGRAHLLRRPRWPDRDVRRGALGGEGRAAGRGDPGGPGELALPRPARPGGAVPSRGGGPGGGLSAASVRRAGVDLLVWPEGASWPSTWSTLRSWNALRVDADTISSYNFDRKRTIEGYDSKSRVRTHVMCPPGPPQGLRRARRPSVSASAGRPRPPRRRRRTSRLMRSGSSSGRPRSTSC